VTRLKYTAHQFLVTKRLISITSFTRPFYSPKSVLLLRWCKRADACGSWRLLFRTAAAISISSFCLTYLHSIYTIQWHIWA